MIEFSVSTIQKENSANKMLDFSVHDDFLINFHVDYEKKKIEMMCEKTFPTNDRYQMVFENTIFCNCTFCQLWGVDNTFYYMDFEQNREKIEEYLKDIDFPSQKEDININLDQYIVFRFYLCSGDIINIVSKKLIIKQSGDNQGTVSVKTLPSKQKIKTE